MTHDIVVLAATLFAVLPDWATLTVMGGELTLHGDGSFITGTELGAQIY